MLILHTGDLHYDEHSPRWDETLRVHAGIAQRVRERKPQLICIPGDVFERRSTPRERAAVADWLQELAATCPVLLVRGNHDAPEDLAIMAKLDAPHPIVVVEDARVVEIAGAAVACVAWPTRAGAIDDGLAREQLRDVLRGLSVDLADRGSGKPRLAIGHFDLDGAKSGTGQPIIGGSLRVSLADLGLLGAQAVLMSHIHAAQDFEWCGAPIIYAGSPVAHDYGEIETKSIVWLEVDGEHVSFAREPTGARPMILGEAAWDTEGPGWVWALETPALSCMEESVIAGADVRFRFHVRADLQAVARAEAQGLRDRLLAMGAARVALDPVVEATGRARDGAMAVVSARTLAEKLEAVWTARGDVPEPQVADRLKSKLHQLERHELPQGART